MCPRPGEEPINQLPLQSARFASLQSACVLANLGRACVKHDGAVGALFLMLGNPSLRRNRVTEQSGEGTIFTSTHDPVCAQRPTITFIISPLQPEPLY